MGNSLSQYRAAIGLYNSSKFQIGTTTSENTFLQIFFILLFDIFLFFTVQVVKTQIPYFENQIFLQLVITLFVLMFNVTITIKIFSGYSSKHLLNWSFRKCVVFTKGHTHICNISISCLTLLCMLLQMFYCSYGNDRCLLSGDIETNPGPSFISVCHINIRSLSSVKFLALKHQI